MVAGRVSFCPVKYEVVGGGTRTFYSQEKNLGGLDLFFLGRECKAAGVSPPHFWLMPVLSEFRFILVFRTPASREDPECRRHDKGVELSIKPWGFHRQFVAVRIPTAQKKSLNSPYSYPIEFPGREVS